MNELLRHPFPASRQSATTRVADGLPRRAWTADEVRRMVEAGIVDGDEPFELIGGELVAKMQKGIAHENLKRMLNKRWGKIRPDHIEFVPESPLRLGPHDEPEPEFVVYPASIPLAEVRGDTVLLVVEIADSSLAHDRSVKMERYVSHGVREYWVVNANTRVTTVFQDPQPTGYARRFDVGSALLTPLLVPELALRMDDLE